MNTLIIICAKYLILLPVVVAGVYFLMQPFRTKKQLFFFALFAIPLIGVIALIGGHIYDNPRPFVVGNFTPLIPHAPDNGFPSDHELLASAIAAILYFFNRRVGTALWIVAALIGIARVWAGIHHPVDIIGSMIISGVVAAGVYQLYLRPRIQSW